MCALDGWCVCEPRSRAAQAVCSARQHCRPRGMQQPTKDKERQPLRSRLGSHRAAHRPESRRHLQCTCLASKREHTTMHMSGTHRRRHPRACLLAKCACACAFACACAWCMCMYDVHVHMRVHVCMCACVHGCMCACVPCPCVHVFTCSCVHWLCALCMCRCVGVHANMHVSHAHVCIDGGSAHMRKMSRGSIPPPPPPPPPPLPLISSSDSPWSHRCFF